VAVEVSPQATHLLELVREGPAGADELAARGALDAGTVSTALTELELAGLVATADGVYRAAS
jgi:predicted Rossmann fold nucleotide-binding protein DprA/Smf involved in DNA uptake